MILTKKKCYLKISETMVQITEHELCNDRIEFPLFDFESILIIRPQELEPHYCQCWMAKGLG
jgi:hypothetical protein